MWHLDCLLSPCSHFISLKSVDFVAWWRLAVSSRKVIAWSDPGSHVDSMASKGLRSDFNFCILFLILISFLPVLLSKNLGQAKTLQFTTWDKKLFYLLYSTTMITDPFCSFPSLLATFTVNVLGCGLYSLRLGFWKPSLDFSASLRLTMQ